MDEECDRELDPKDYPDVKSWTKWQWQEHSPKSTSTVPGSTNAKSSRGSGRMAKGINVSCTYIQDEQGNVVSAQRTKAIRDLMLSSFRQLQTQGLAPESIGQASLEVLRWLHHTLRKQFLELRLCAGNWKSMKLMGDNYFQWYNYHVKKRGTKRIKSEDVTPTSDELPIPENHGTSIDSLHSRSTPEPSSFCDSFDAMIDPQLQEPTTKKRRIEDPEITTSEPLLQIEIPLSPADTDEPAPPSPSSENKKQIETLDVETLEIKNPLEGFVFNCTATTPPSMPPCEAKLADMTSLAIKTELVAATDNTMKATKAKAAGESTKKRQPSVKPMRVSKNITARNICALDWQANGHQREPASAFALYWINLSASIKEEYKTKTATRLRSSSMVQASDSADVTD